MAEGQNTEGEGGQIESSGLLADKLFGKAFAKNAEEHLEKAKADLARGAQDQAAEHLKKVGMSLAQSLTKMTSPRLSDTENEEWLRLQSRKYNITDGGFIMERILDEGNEARMRYLDKKAFGQGKQK